jgi:hypothetical protein
VVLVSLLGIPLPLSALFLLFDVPSEPVLLLLVNVFLLLHELSLHLLKLAGQFHLVPLVVVELLNHSLQTFLSLLFLLVEKLVVVVSLGLRAVVAFVISVYDRLQGSVYDLGVALVGVYLRVQRTSHMFVSGSVLELYGFVSPSPRMTGLKSLLSRDSHATC